jgi:hypothetical protein
VYIFYIIVNALKLNPAVRVRTSKLGNSIMQLGSVDEPLYHIGDLVTSSNPTPLYLVQLVSNKLSLLSISDICAFMKGNEPLCFRHYNPVSVL